MNANIKLNKLICIVVCSFLALAVIFGLAGCTNTDNSTTDSNIKTDNSTEGSADSSTDTDANSSTENTAKLEYGFKYRTDVCIDCAPVGHTAYKSNTDTFYIDNVTLTFYFGTLWGNRDEASLERVHKTYIDVPRFKLVFADEKEEDIHTIKTVEENYISQKYGLKYTDYREEGWGEYQFYHCEDLTIPKDLFCKKRGVVHFMIYGVDVHTGEPEEILLNAETIKYEFIGPNKVILSPTYTPADYIES